MGNYDMVTVIGHTAGGKTSVAVRLAHELKGEVISGDSRQVYKGMDIGTGKDLGEYAFEGTPVPYHLIDIVDAGYKYNVYEFQQDFEKVYLSLKAHKRFPVFCGGTGLYVEAILKGYKLIQVPVDKKLREELENMNLEELTNMLAKMKKLHNSTDVDTKKRAIRAIEIEKHYQANEHMISSFPKINSLLVGIRFDRDSRRKRITTRLKQRLEEGMVDEAKNLIEKGLSMDDLTYYGLEYKYLALYLFNKLSYKEMFEQLNIAIHQFAKRQMTWYRRMERNGMYIHWLDGNMPMDEKIERVLNLLDTETTNYKIQ